ncbi:hypothetical protein CICLE_v100124842mg, partial [Citrus x clementina]|jgi:hypothetical protein
VLKK